MHKEAKHLIEETRQGLYDYLIEQGTGKAYARSVSDNYARMIAYDVDVQISGLHPAVLP